MIDSPRTCKGIAEPGMSKPGKNASVQKHASTAYSYIAVIIEFVGVIGFMGLLGHMIDTRFFSVPGKGVYMLIGLLIGFIYAFFHLLRRVKAISERIAGTEEPSGPPLNRDGYHENLDERIAKIDSSMEEVRRRIDDLPGGRGPRK